MPVAGTRSLSNKLESAHLALIAVCQQEEVLWKNPRLFAFLYLALTLEGQGTMRWIGFFQSRGKVWVMHKESGSKCQIHVASHGCLLVHIQSRRARRSRFSISAPAIPQTALFSIAGRPLS